MSTKLLELIKTRKNSPRGKHSVISYQLMGVRPRVVRTAWPRYLSSGGDNKALN
ncbi:MAG: hypothetical protein F6K55_34460 [Moorea sp. SIO4A3]|nr:hypothetical protein [Moorena sp. SIO4A3]